MDDIVKSIPEGIQLRVSYAVNAPLELSQTLYVNTITGSFVTDTETIVKELNGSSSLIECACLSPT